jgi:hypothetical protein
MTRPRPVLLICALCAALAYALAMAGSASAGIHSVRVQVDYPGSVGPDKRVYMDMEGLNAAQDTQITVRRPGVVTPIEDEHEFSGDEELSTYALDLLEPGDLIEIRQPASAPAPTVTFQTPTASVGVSGTSVVGSVGPAARNVVTADGTCLTESRTAELAAAGGSFSADFGTDLAPGARVVLTSFDGNGFEFALGAAAPGERACIEADGVPALYNSSIPGIKDPTPFHIQLDNLSPLITTTRIVLRRGGAIIDDQSKTTYSSGAEDLAVAPQPGDQIELYRPQTAAAPSQVATIPRVSGVFDPASDQAAVSGPAGRMLRVYACQPMVCSGSGRTLLDRPAGRTFFDFTTPQSYERAFNLQADSVVQSYFQSATEPIAYRFALSPGDLVAPAQSFRLASKLKRSVLVKAFKKGFKVRVKSNEAGSAKLALTLPLPAKRAKSRPKSVTLAGAVKRVRAGTTTIALKFTKPGKKALRKFARRSSHTALLTSTVTDASGNASVVVKRTKIKA